MAFDATSIAKVRDAVIELEGLNALRQAGILRVGESTAAQLTDSERDTIRTRILARVDVLRGICRAEVGSWPP